MSTMFQFFSAPGRKKLDPIKTSLEQRGLITKIENSFRKKPLLKSIKSMTNRGALYEDNSFVRNLPSVHVEKFLFGNIIKLIKKVIKYHRLMLIRKFLKKNKAYLKNAKAKSKFLTNHNVRIFDYCKALRKFDEIIIEGLNFRRMMLVLNFISFMNTQYKRRFLNVIKHKHNLFISSIIKIQSCFRRSKAVNDYKKKRKNYFDKIGLIQRFFRGFSLRKSIANDLQKIKKNLSFRKKKKDFEKQMDEMKRRKKAVRVIEK